MISSIWPRRVADVWRLINRKTEPVDESTGISFGAIGTDGNNNGNSYLVSLGDRGADEQQREHHDTGGHHFARVTDIASTSRVGSINCHHHFILVPRRSAELDVDDAADIRAMQR